MKLTIKEASELSGTPDKTLYRWIKAGKLSATKDALGVTVIDISELQRVCPNLKTENAQQEQLVKVENLPENPPVLSNTEIITLLRAQNRLLESQLQTANTEKASLLRTLESQSQVLALPKPEAETETEKKAWWRKLRFATLI